MNFSESLLLRDIYWVFLSMTGHVDGIHWVKLGFCVCYFRPVKLVCFWNCPCFMYGLEPTIARCQARLFLARYCLANNHTVMPNTNRWTLLMIRLLSLENAFENCSCWSLFQLSQNYILNLPKLIFNFIGDLFGSSRLSSHVESWPAFRFCGGLG